MARSTYEDFTIKEKIGSGSYGVVFKVLRRVDHNLYAMKEIDLQGMSRKEQEECIRETRVLSSLDSDFIIKYYDSFLERGKLYIITEYAANGNLHDYIKKQKTRLPEELIWKLFLQILMGLNHMHSRKILHRDIKTLNVFLDDGMNVKLGDMGVAKILSTQTNFAKTIVGTPYYLSPELCEDKPYNEKSDVWALGVVLYECCTQRHPFDADNQGALILKILRGKYPQVTNYSPEITDLIKRCLTQNANRRPNTFKLLMLPSVRAKAEEIGIVLPDMATLQELAAAHAAAKPRPSRTPSARGDRGDMDAPPAPAEQPPPAEGSNQDKAFVFGSTMPSRAAGPRATPVDVSVSGVEQTPGDVAGSVPEAQQVEANWRVPAEGEPSPPPRVRGYGWGGVQQLENLDIEDDGEEDEEHNPYNDPRSYRDPEDGEEEGGEEDYDGDEYYEGEEYEEEYEEDGAAWQPDPTRLQHMKSALMIQRAACLQLIGDKAYDELYALLKSNQVDEASMTDLSRLVFKIIPYDKSEVIQMMYKLLYLESQLESAGGSAQ